MIKKPMNQEDVAILNVHASNNRASKIQKAIEMQIEKGIFTIITGDFKTHLFIRDKISAKIN